MKILGLIKRNLRSASKTTKLTAYKALCRPTLEYGSPVWDPSKKGCIYDLEMVQNRAIRFICSLKGRDASITNTRKELNLQTLEQRRTNSRIKLLLKMLEDSHPILGDFADSELSQHTQHQTRAQTQHLLTSLCCNTSTFFNSFLPRTVRDLRHESDDQ